MTGADLNAMEERLLAQMTAMKPPVMRLVAMLGRVDSWVMVWLNGLGFQGFSTAEPGSTADR